MNASSSSPPTWTATGSSTPAPSTSTATTPPPPPSPPPGPAKPESPSSPTSTKSTPASDLLPNIDLSSSAATSSPPHPTSPTSKSSTHAAPLRLPPHHAATLGPDGVLAWDGKDFHRTAAYKVPAIDTTGAGDIFHAGFIYGLLQAWPLDRQLDFACAAAAHKLHVNGARVAESNRRSHRKPDGHRHPLHPITLSYARKARYRRIVAVTLTGSRSTPAPSLYFPLGFVSCSRQERSRSNHHHRKVRTS